MRILSLRTALLAIGFVPGLARSQSSTQGPITNVSALVQIPAGPGALSAPLGFSLSAPSPLLVRGVGPALAAFGVGGTAVAPYLDFFTPSGPVDFGARVAIAWDWNAAAAVVGAFPLPAPTGAPVNGQGPVDSSDVETFQPGTYMARAFDNSHQGGTALVELYTGGVLVPLGNPGIVRPTPPPGDISNCSLLVTAGPGAQPQILGFTLNAPATVLIRAVGPSLAAFGVPNSARAPQFQLWKGASPYAYPVVTLSDNDWAGIVAAVGAFTLSAPSGDDAAVTFLPAGSYTLTGANADPTAAATSSVLLLEVYVVPDLGIL